MENHPTAAQARAARNAAAALEAQAAGLDTVALGGEVFVLHPMPWGQLKKVCAAISKVGAALSGGGADESVMDQMTLVLALGLGKTPAEIEAMPATMHEIGAAFRALMRASGMEAEMEHNLGELRRRVQTMAPPPAPSGSPAPSSGGTSSTQASPPSPAGSGV